MCCNPDAGRRPLSFGDGMFAVQNAQQIGRFRIKPDQKSAIAVFQSTRCIIISEIGEIAEIVHKNAGLIVAEQFEHSIIERVGFFPVCKIGDLHIGNGFDLSGLLGVVIDKRLILFNRTRYDGRKRP